MPSAVTSNVTSAARSAFRRASGASAPSVKISSSGTTPSGRFSPNAPTKRIENVSAARSHGDGAVVDLADHAARDQRTRAGLLQRRRRVRLPPEQRQRRRDHSGAQYAEQRDRALDRVGKLQRHDGAGRQAVTAQHRGERRDRAIALRVGEAARRAVGHARAVRRIDQRERIRPARERAAEEVVERGAHRMRRRRSRARSRVHGLLCHQVSGTMPCSEVFSGRASVVQRATH